ncbi:MAG TPA: hypothetical protein VJM11_19625 [Nevskiaceae bacterium]|nr:hypothetical protein [Nevskiaceae bacterium]
MLALGLGACTSAPVVAPSKFPTPMVRKVPANLGLYFDPAFVAYVHRDKPEVGPKQDVNVGPASKALFTEYLIAQFSRVVVVSQLPPAGVPAGIEAVLVPQIAEVQIAAPKTKKDEFYEAWIRYRLHLVSLQGTQLASWELDAYGKHRGAAIGGSNEAWTLAVEDAMRDAAAGMALVFKDPAAFRALLQAPPAPGGPTT